MHKAPILMALLAAVLFGAATPADKLLLNDGLMPLQLAGLLYIGAAVVVAPAALSRGGLALPPRGDRRTWLRLLGSVLFGGVAGPVALLFALRLAGAGSVSLWLNLELAATAILGAIVFRDHVGRRGWLGIATAFGASTLLAWGPAGPGPVAGALVALACFCWGLDNHLTALIDGITPSQSTFWKATVAGVFNLTIGLVINPLSVDFVVLAFALIVGALCYGASIVLYIGSAQRIGAVRAQVLFATAPFVGLALSVAALGEGVTATQAVSVPLFLIGVSLLLVESHSHFHLHEAIFHEHSHRHDDGHHNHVHPGLPASVRHTHPHQHEPIDHRHPHWPDLHHRHRHTSSEQG